MEERRDTGKEGKMHEMKDIKEECMKQGIQETRGSEKEGFRKGGIPERKDVRKK